MFVVVCPRAEVHYDEEAYKQRNIELKRQRLKAIEEKDAKKEKELQEQEDTSVMSNMINKVIRNFELRIDEIHIRYEDHSSDPKHPFCGGVCLHSIIVSPNKENPSEDADGSTKQVQHNGVFTKDILIDRFGVYWDSDSKYQVNTSNAIALTRDMEYAFTKPADASNLPVPTHFIVHPLSLDVLLHIDIRGVELRKPTPEQAALSAMRELGWNQEVLVNQKFMKAYAKIKRDGIRGRSEKEETELFIAKFKEKYPKFCSSVNLQFAAEFSALCWKYANTASPIVVASATLPQLTVTVLQNQIRDAATLLANLSLQSKRAQQSFDRPEKSVMKAPRAWWRYAIQCVKKEAREKRVSTSWKDYLRFKKQRNEYIVLYKRSIHAQGYQSLKKDKKAQQRKQELEDLFSLENTVLFRKMARMEIEREGGIDSLESSSEEEMRAELYKDVEVSDEDMNPWEGGQPLDIVLSADFMLGSTQVVLMREGEKLMDIILNQVCLQAFKRKEYLELWFMLNDLKVLDSSPAKTRYKEIVVVNKPTSAVTVATPQSDEVAEGGSKPILPANFRGAVACPFLQGHMELPALDNNSDMRVRAQVQSLDVVVNTEWLLELVKFLVPNNVVNMSSYEEKAYNLVTGLRNGEVNIASTVMKNRGFSLDVALQPINLIIPDSCSAHRSKTNLLLCQLGEIAVTSQPRQPIADASLITPQDAYNTIDVVVHDVAIGFVGGRVFASHVRESNLVTQGFEDTLLVKPFDIGMKVGLCLVNDVRYASMTMAIDIRPIVLNVTRSVVAMAASWAVPILTSFVSKQKELDLDVLSLLLLPKQLLFSCIEYQGSIFAADHDTEAWANSPDRLHRTLYKVLNASQAAEQGEAQTVMPSLSSVRSTMSAVPAMESLEEHTHGVVHLSYEDLVLLQYKPSMTIHLTVEKVAVEVFHPVDVQKKLLELELNTLTMDYSDHMYDMDIRVKVPCFSLIDHACASSPDGRLMAGSSNASAPFLNLRFATIGELSMMNETFNAATIVLAELGPIACKRCERE